MAKESSDIDMRRLLPVGEVAARAGVAVSALHFYETKGLIRSIRSGGNQRRYARGVLRRVAVIKAAQRVGIPLEEIKAALDTLPPDRSPTAADWAGLSLVWKDDLDSRKSHMDGAEEHDHDDFDSFVLSGGEVADVAALMAALGDVIAAHDVLRIKGMVAVAGKPSRLVIQAVGPRVQHFFDRAWKPDEARQTGLVVIGQKGLDRAAIEAGLRGVVG